MHKVRVSCSAVGTFARRAHVITDQESETAFNPPVFRETTSRSRATRTAPARRPARWSWRRSRATRAASPPASTRSQYAPTCAALLKRGLLIVEKHYACARCWLLLSRGVSSACPFVCVRPSDALPFTLHSRASNPNRQIESALLRAPHTAAYCTIVIFAWQTETTCSFLRTRKSDPLPSSFVLPHYSQSQHSWRAQCSKQSRKNASKHIDFLFVRTTLFPYVKTTFYFIRSSYNIPTSVFLSRCA